MVNRLVQQTFRAEPFDSDSFNLHIGPGQRRTVVVAVHGLGGSGYGTWDRLLADLHDGRDDAPVDVGVYDYVSGPRRLRGRRTPPNFWVEQLARNVRQLGADYDHIVLLGHSLGGLVAEDVAMHLLQAQRMAGDADPEASAAAAALAALVLVASPRAGTGLAFAPVRWLLPELRLLKPLSRRRDEVHAFFNTYVERLNVTSAAPGKLVLPTFAAVAGSDRLVNAFSSAFEVPKHQRKPLSAGHRSVVRPRAADDHALLRWLQQVVTDCLDVRQQAARERRHEIQRPGTPGATFRDGIITAFRSDAGGSRWELLYNEARSAASTATATVLDIRDVPHGQADLLIAVHDAHLILQPDPGVQRFVEAACAARAQWPDAVVGVAPVGADHLPAQAALRTTVTALTLASVYVDGALDHNALRAVLLRWFQLVLGRDPRRRRPFDSTDFGYDLEQTWNGGML